MNYDAHLHRAILVNENLEEYGLERMDCPGRSSDLNPIEHTWDYLGSQLEILSTVKTNSGINQRKPRTLLSEPDNSNYLVSCLPRQKQKEAGFFSIPSFPA
ncbi:hypothetical protein AVEN_194598-1 [Araneus ventricosus]|uniref:Tc1-like transposase DDE domain-containing protein n=1 Tax=Araneus ventricosus TaxID=182803 RepID=A0A4Y2A855_ARAVE|nr:hypothetical protein AVEN_194598-1 [Araneus ventricosus]